MAYAMVLPRQARKNRPTTMDERRRQVAALYIHGLTQAEIAQRVGVSQPTVSTDLAAIRAQWRESAARDYAERLAEELARLDQVEQEAWAAYVDSQRPAGKGRAKCPGDPRYLAIVFKAIESRLRAIGAGGSDPRTPVAQPASAIPWDALMQVATGQALLGKAPDGRPQDPFGDMIQEAIRLSSPPPPGTVIQHPATDDNHDEEDD